MLRLNSAVNAIIARLIINLPKPKEQIGKTVLFKRLGSEDNEIKSHANIHDVYDIIRMLDDSSYPSAYLSLDKVKMEFSEIVKEAGNLYCKVQISEKKLEQKLIVKEITSQGYQFIACGMDTIMIQDSAKKYLSSFKKR